MNSYIVTPSDIYLAGKILDRSFHPSVDSVSMVDMDYQYQHISMPPAVDNMTTQ